MLMGGKSWNVEKKIKVLNSGVIYHAACYIYKLGPITSNSTGRYSKQSKTS